MYPFSGVVGRLCPSMFRVVDVYSCVPPPQKHFWKRALPETIIPEEMSCPSFSPGSTALEVPDPRRRGPYRRKKTPPVQTSVFWSANSSFPKNARLQTYSRWFQSQVSLTNCEKSKKPFLPRRFCFVAFVLFLEHIHILFL